MATIVYTIETLQPVKVATQGSQTDVQSSTDYLPGVTLRGALLAKYFRQNNGTVDLDTDRTQRQRWLNGDTRFLNAYPLVDGERGMPFPNHLFAAKAAMKLHDSGSSQTLKVKSLFEATLFDDDKRAAYGGFIARVGTERQRISVTKKFHLHVSLQEMQNNLLFRYEAIEPNQRFQAVIHHADEALVAFVEGLKGHEIYVGGSRSSGYGRCRIVSVTFTPDEERGFQALSAGESFMVFAQSDWLLRDAYGFPSTSLAAVQLASWLGGADLQLKAIGSAVQTTEVGGYVEKWGSTMPLQTAVQKGSVFAFEIVAGSIDLMKADALQRRGVGDRRLEGFGEAVLFTPTQFAFSALRRGSNQTESVRHGVTSRAAAEDRSRLHQLQQRGVHIRLQSRTEKHVLDLYEVTKQGKKLTSSQIGKLMQLAFAERLSVRAHAADVQVVERSKQKIFDYFHHLVSRHDGKERNNQRAKEMLEQFQVNKQSMIDFYQSFVRGADSSTYKTYFGDLAVEATAPEKYMQSLWLLEQYLRYCMRQNKAGGARK
jgi:CRISPR-associated protein Csx10